MSLLIRPLLFSALLAVSTATLAHGEKAHAKAAAPLKLEQTDWGIGGHASAVRRTVTIRMTDNMRFAPDFIQVKQGETIHSNSHFDFLMGSEAGLRSRNFQAWSCLAQMEPDCLGQTGG